MNELENAANIQFDKDCTENSGMDWTHKYIYKNGFLRGVTYERNRHLHICDSFEQWALENEDQIELMCDAKKGWEACERNYVDELDKKDKELIALWNRLSSHDKGEAEAYGAYPVARDLVNKKSK